MSKRLQLLLQLFDNNPADSFTVFALAKEYEGAGDDEQALHFYQKLKNNDPGYVGLYYHLGKLLERKNDPEQALQIYREGIEVARSARDFHAMNELVGAKMNLGDYDDDEDF